MFNSYFSVESKKHKKKILSCSSVQLLLKWMGQFHTSAAPFTFLPLGFITSIFTEKNPESFTLFLGVGAPGIAPIPTRGLCAVLREAAEALCGCPFPRPSSAGFMAALLSPFNRYNH